MDRRTAIRAGLASVVGFVANPFQFLQASSPEESEGTEFNIEIEFVYRQMDTDAIPPAITEDDYDGILDGTPIEEIPSYFWISSRTRMKGGDWSEFSDWVFVGQVNFVEKGLNDRFFAFRDEEERHGQIRILRH